MGACAPLLERASASTIPGSCTSRAANGDGSVDPPYASLLTLVGALEDDPETVIEGSVVRLGTIGQNHLLEWCGKHGVLGLLPHQSVLATLAPRWDDFGGSHSCVPCERVHRRDHYGWSASFDVVVRRLPRQMSVSETSSLPISIATPGRSRWHSCI